MRINKKIKISIIVSTFIFLFVSILSFSFISNGNYSFDVRNQAASMTAPTNLNVTCPTPGTKATLTWTAPVNGAAKYLIRVNNTKNPWEPSGSNPYSGDIINNDFIGTSFSFPSEANATYEWWIHAVGKDGSVSAETRGWSFKCDQVRPDICNSLSISATSISQNGSVTITLRSNTNLVREFAFAFYNTENSTSGGPKPVYYEAGKQYIITRQVSSPTYNYTVTVNYNDVYRPDLNFGGKIPKQLQINGYLNTSAGNLSVPVNRCVVALGVIPPAPPAPTPTPTSPSIPRTPTPTPTRPRTPTPTPTRPRTTTNPQATPTKTPGGNGGSNNPTPTVNPSVGSQEPSPTPTVAETPTPIPTDENGNPIPTPTSSIDVDQLTSNIALTVKQGTIFYTQQPVLTGKTLADLKVQVTVYSQNTDSQTGTVTADKDGKFSYTPERPLPYGEYRYWAVLVNDDGTKGDIKEYIDFQVQQKKSPIGTILLIGSLLAGIGIALFLWFKTRRSEPPMDLNEFNDFDPQGGAPAPMLVDPVVYQQEPIEQEYLQQPDPQQQQPVVQGAVDQQYVQQQEVYQQQPVQQPSAQGSMEQQLVDDYTKF